MGITTIQSLDRGLEILIIIGKANKPLSLNDISSHFSIDRSSVFRLIGTLVQRGFIHQDSETKRYSLGYRMLELAGSFSEHAQIESLIRPIMKRICETVKHNTHLAVLDGNEVVFIAVEQPRESIALTLSVGTRESAQVSALGKALLAFTAPDKQEEILSSIEFRQFTEKSIMSVQDLKRVLNTVRRDRLAQDDGEHKNEIACLAAPILDHRNHVLFSIGISGPRDMIIPHFEDYKKIIRDAGIEASTLLGNNGVNPPAQDQHRAADG
jgi:IclR family KDG regulon transcriptional repressor